MSFTVGESITIPSPIDVHMHLRFPGGEEKETMESGTRAALLGGYQAVFDMPNTNPPTWTEKVLDLKIQEALRGSSYVDIGFYAGVDLENPDIDQLRRMIGKAAGLKLYMGHTTGNKKTHNLDTARDSIDGWVEAASQQLGNPPVLLHAQGAIGAETAEYIAQLEYPVHWCHVSSASEIDASSVLARVFPDQFTAGVTPHHLLMSERDTQKYGWNGARMMPKLGDDIDQDYLQYAFSKGMLHILETDHAPHTREDKMQAEAQNPLGHDDVEDVTCFGVSGVEFVLPIMMGMVQRGEVTMERLVDALHTQPARMLGLDAQRNRAFTTIKVEPYVLESVDRKGRSSNTPYVNWTAWGKVMDVVVDGQHRAHDGNVVTKPTPRIVRVGSDI